MHILMTANLAWNIWNFRKPVVQALLAAGHKVTVLAPPDDFVEKLKQLGCSFIPLRLFAKSVNPFRDLMLIGRYRQIFIDQKPDVVLSYTIKSNVFGGLAAKSLRIPFAPNVSGLGTGFLAGSGLQFIVEQLYRLAYRGLPIIFFQNEDDSDLFLSRRLVQPEQVRLLPGSGIDLEHFKATDLPKGGQPVFLMIARLLRDKGVIEFVEAARQVKSEMPDARFQLLGPIGSENRTAISSEMVSKWVQEGVVEYLGMTDDVRPMIAAASCVVLPSYREGAPRTLIEAASMGRPLITTDVPGCRAVVHDKETGFLCSARNSESLAFAMHCFLELSHDRQSEMGIRGREKMVREYDQRLVIQAYVDALQSLTGKAVLPTASPKYNYSPA